MESVRAATERIAPLLDRVGAEQSRHIERGFAEDNRRFAKEYLRGSDEDKRRRRIKRTVERIEDWVGGLSDAQLARVQQYAERVPPAEELRTRDRLRMQAGILEIVRSGRSSERLADFLLGWQASRDPAYVAAGDAWRREAFALALDLDRMLTPEQRARAVARLRGYAADFAALAEKRTRQ